MKRKKGTDVISGKKTRLDVTLRKQEAKNFSITIIKTSLKSFTTKDGSELNWNYMLKNLNTTVTEAYILANLLVLRLCEKGKEIHLLDQTFFYRCLSAVSISHRKKQDIQDLEFKQSINLYNSLKPKDYQSPKSTHLSLGFHQCLSLQMAT